MRGTWIEIKNREDDQGFAVGRILYGMRGLK